MGELVDASALCSECTREVVVGMHGPLYRARVFTNRLAPGKWQNSWGWGIEVAKTWGLIKSGW